MIENVSIPQAVWIACNISPKMNKIRGRAVSIPQAVWIACNEDVHDKFDACSDVSIPQAVWIACNSTSRRTQLRSKPFQYRKRYGLHAIKQETTIDTTNIRFNTASGMDCMQ